MILWAFVVAVFAAIAAAGSGPIMSRVEQPEYQVTSSEGSIEIREYGAMIAAEAEVMGERKAAGNHRLPFVVVRSVRT
jgi:hypothetical protein